MSLVAKNINQEKMSEDLKTYNALKQAQPKNSLEKRLNREILCYLSLVYEHH